ncbi:hypothetical protein EV426DRAFT_615636 [Tirmania nivea]|nr:hypothetical protein EV426DRAFT_615636 [Tirmania nivea]
MFRNLPILIVLSLNLLTIAVHAANWDLWIHRGEADEDFYGMSHHMLQIMPAGLRSNGWLLDTALNNDGLTYRKRNKEGYNLMSPGSKLLTRDLTDAEKDNILAAFNAEPAPDPTANPHKNCQDFVANVIIRAGLENKVPTDKRSLYAVQENLKPDNSAASEGTATTPGRYFAHTNNFQSGAAVKQWTFTGALNAKRRRSVEIRSIVSWGDEISGQSIQRRTPVRQASTAGKSMHFMEGVKSTPLPPAGKCPPGQQQKTRVDPKTRKTVPVTKMDPKTKKPVPDCAPVTAPTTKCPPGQKQKTRVDPRTRKTVPLTKIDPRTKKAVPDCAPATVPTTPRPGSKKPGPGTQKPVKQPAKPGKTKPVTRPRTGRKGKVGRRV